MKHKPNISSISNIFLPATILSQPKHQLSTPPFRNQTRLLPAKTPISDVRTLLRRRRTKSSSLDSFTLLRSLKSESHPPSIPEGSQIHSLIITLGFHSIIFLQTALLSLYSSNGHITDAHKMFAEMPQRTVVAYTAMISAYVNNRRPSQALDLFRQMQLERVQPDAVTLTVALSACADLGARDTGEWIHAYISRRRNEVEEDLILTNAVINMYTKCGDLRAAHLVFEKAKERDAASWTSMIAGHALNGSAEEALRLFAQMKSHCRPNGVTFVGVLTACSHAGLVDEGRRQWESMVSCYGLEPGIGHYGCMVDLLCRAGRLEEAHGFIERMPVRANAVIWRTLLGACSLHGDVSVGARARQRLLELEPDYAGDCVAMANAFASIGRWDEKERARRRMRRRRAPGCSLVEVESRVHEFVDQDEGDSRYS